MNPLLHPLSISVLAAVALVGHLSGCRSTAGADPYQPASEGRRDTRRAQQLTQEAVAIIDTNPAKAERLLREALGADLFHGPAHNNLGVVYLSRGDLYSAAAEFEWARKLMPGAPDPRMNLALTLERAGRTDDAIREYESALGVQAEHLPSIEGIVRLQVRSGKTDDRTHGRLQAVAMRGDEQWRDWAQRQLLAIEAR